MKTFITADIHGGHKALIQCIERSGFDTENDELIVIGDVVDGWPETYQCIDELLKMKNLVYILGNHDEWCYNWATHNERDDLWISQGGWNTLKSYNFNMPNKHIELLKNANLWVHDEEKDILFVHGGIDKRTVADLQPARVLMWDRNLMQDAWNNRKTKDYNVTLYKEVFIGHTSTVMFGTNEPIHIGNIWNIDTGAGWSGKLTFMDLDTREYWQSDLVRDLYPGSEGRGDYARHKPEVKAWLNGN